MRIFFLVLCSLALVLPACAAPPAPAPATVDTLIGEARCEEQAQCRSIGVGAKPCGGPAGYRAWSTLNTDEKALLSLVEQEARTQRQADAKEGLRSNCAMVADPGAVCRPRAGDGAKTCQLARTASGGVGRAD